MMAINFIFSYFRTNMEKVTLFSLSCFHFPSSLPGSVYTSQLARVHGQRCWFLSSSHVEDQFNKDPLNVPIVLQYSNIFHQLFEISHLFNWYMRALSAIRVIRVQVSRFPILPRVIVSQDRRIPFVQLDFPLNSTFQPSLKRHQPSRKTIANAGFVFAICLPVGKV